METTRKENEFVLTVNDIIYSAQFWVTFFLVAFILERLTQNYIMASLFCYMLIKYFGNDELHFYKNKLSKLLLRKYAYTTKLVLAVILAVTIIMSWFSFKAFICSIVLSIIWNEYMKVFTKRKSLI